MLIRKASKDDLETVLRFAGEMARMHHGLDKYYKVPEDYKSLPEDLEQELADPNTLTLIAEDSGSPIGYIRVSAEDAPQYVAPKKIGMVYDLFVDEAHRREGVGEKLFNEALEWLRAKNIKHIELSVDARNADAMAVWKKFGFFEYKVRMRKDLE